MDGSGRDLLVCYLESSKEASKENEESKLKGEVEKQQGEELMEEDDIEEEATDGRPLLQYPGLVRTTGNYNLLGVPPALGRSRS